MPKASHSPRLVLATVLAIAAGSIAKTAPAAAPQSDQEAAKSEGVDFTVRSVKSGKWSEPATWQPARSPREGDRVLVSRNTDVMYDVQSDQVIRLVQVVGAFRFSREHDTELNVGVLKIQNSEVCSESGFACDFEHVNSAGEPTEPASGAMPTLEIGAPDAPIPPEHTATVRLHYLDGMNKDDAPSLVCCSARMEIHGAPMSRTWVKLGDDVKSGDTTIVLSEPVTGWKEGDEVIVTGSRRSRGAGNLRNNPQEAATETRGVVRIEERTLHLDAPLKHEHFGSGEFRSEVANLSRNVMIESAEPDGIRGHTMYHAFSRGGISYARFAHLGKEGVLGRYPIHFHLVADTMRGSQVRGAAIVDSHNRWVTIHGTYYLVVRDCIGYQSVGHGFFMEDATEVDNLLQGNLGVQAYRGRRLPDQVLPFDPNDGAAYWWANGRNTLVGNVACENDEYGFRYDMQNSRSFSSTLPIRMPDGSTRAVDVRTIPIWRFDNNESHTEGLYGLVVAANGNSQPDTPIRDERMLRRINQIDWTGPDTRHPHIIRNLKVWESHYAFRPHSPSMLMENIRIHRAAYGIYRPAFEDHVYRNLNLSDVGPEPFNRGMDDASAQTGRITVDGFTIDSLVDGNQLHPVIHMSDNDLTGRAESHFRNLSYPTGGRPRRPVFNPGGSVRVDPFVDDGIPYFVHGHFGAGRHAKIVSTKAADLMDDGESYREQWPLTGDASVVTEVRDIEWPELLDPVDDLPPATIVTSIRKKHDGKLAVSGVSHDNGQIEQVVVEGQKADIVASVAGVVDWHIAIDSPAEGIVAAHASDVAGNVEQTTHRVDIRGRLPEASNHDHRHSGSTQASPEARQAAQSTDGERRSTIPPQGRAVAASASTRAAVELDPYFVPPAEYANDMGSYRTPLKFDDGRDVETPADWKKRRAEILATWHTIMGTWPPLIEQPHIDFQSEVPLEHHTRHSVEVEVAPGGRTVRGYLMIPHGSGPYPAVLVVYYDAETGAGEGAELRDFGSQLADRGFVSLSIGTPDCTYWPDQASAELQPLSMLAYVAANCHSALASLSYVDPQRIGVVGHSYGGKWAMFASCLYEKFACAVWSDGGIVFDESRPNVNYWEPWYLGYEPGRKRREGVPTADNPRTGAYRVLVEQGHDLHELHALMAPRPFLVSGGSEDRPKRWQALNHSVLVNRLLGESGRVAMTNREGHTPTHKSNAQIYAFFERLLMPVDKSGQR